MKKNIILLITLIFCINIVNAYDLENNLLMHLDYEDNNSIETDKHGTYDSNISGATYTINGLINNAYIFDGTDDYTNISSNLDAPIGENRSYSCWIKTNSSTTDSRTILGGINTGGTDWIQLELNGSNVLRFRADDGTNPITDLNAGIGYNNSIWHNVIVTRDITTNDWYLYVDGELIDSTSAGADTGVNLDEFHIGGYIMAGISSFDGFIDECSVWDKTLTLKEVQEIFNKRQGKQHPFDYWNEEINHNIKSSYTFDNGSLIDYTSNEIDLTNNGSTYISNGLINGAYEFNGSGNYLFANKISTINKSNSFTVSLWFNITDTSNGVNDFMMAHSQNTNDRFAMRFINFGSDPEIQVVHYDGVYQCHIVKDFSDTSNWHHFVMTWNTTDCVGYLDNVSFTTDGGVVDVGIPQPDKLLIGGYTTTPSTNDFNGNIDEVSIFNRVLNQSEITTLYYSGNPNVIQQFPIGNENNLIARLETSHEPSITEETDYTFYGNPTGINGKIDGAINFDGTGDYIIINELIGSQTEMTISFWRRDLYTQISTNIDFTNVAETDYVRQYYNTAGTLSYFQWGIDGSAYEFSATPSALGINDQLWHFISMEWNGTNVSIYVDNELVDVGGISGTFNLDSTDENYVGYWEGVGRDKEGDIDDIRVINHTLTDDERTNLYYNGTSIDGEIVVVTLDGISDQHNYNRIEHQDGNVKVNSELGFVFDGVDDLLTLDSFSPSDIGGNDFTFNFRLQMSDVANSNGILHAGATDYPRLLMWDATDCSEATACIYFYTSATYNKYVGIMQDTEYMVTVTRINDQFTLYINGLPVNVTTDTPTFASSTEFTLGQFTGTPARDLNGSIKEYKYYSRGLSQQEVLYLFNGTYNEYNFNDFSGDLIYSIINFTPNVAQVDTIDGVVVNFSVNVNNSNNESLTYQYLFNDVIQSNTTGNTSEYINLSFTIPFNNHGLNNFTFKIIDSVGGTLTNDWIINITHSPINVNVTLLELSPSGDWFSNTENTYVMCTGIDGDNETQPENFSVEIEYRTNILWNSLTPQYQSGNIWNASINISDLSNTYIDFRCRMKDNESSFSDWLQMNNILIYEDYFEVGNLSITPSNEYADFVVPVTCNVLNYGSYRSNLYTYDIDYYNGTIWQNLSNSKINKALFDMSKINYTDNVKFRCRVNDTVTLSNFIVGSNVTRKHITNLFMFNGGDDEVLLHHTKYYKGLLADFYEENGVSIISSYADCNGDGYFDYYFPYNDSRNTTKETFLCYNSKGLISHTVGVFINKTDSTNRLCGVDKIGICNIERTYKVLIK